MPSKFTLLLLAVVTCTGLASTRTHAQLGPGDYWLQFHGLQPWEWEIDHDGDGLNARSEYELGSDPLLANPGLAMEIMVEGPAKVLLWESTPGVAYQPEKSTDLAEFSPLGGTLLGDGSLFGLELPGLGDEQFFRVSLVAPGDADGDGLSSVEEGLIGSNPDNPDTDGDMRRDGDEVFVTLSDPLVFDNQGGTIRGTVYRDLNGDGDLADGVQFENARVYMDANFNAEFDDDERSALTDTMGNYEFLHVKPGVHHVRQILPAPNVQTFPAGGVTPTYNMLPDEVTNYTHAAPGEGNFDEPYGENASESPGDWRFLDPPGTGAEPVSVDVVLQPIGVRDVPTPISTLNGAEFLTLPKDAHITLRFEELIVDGPGPDLLINSVPTSGPGGEVEVSIGASESALASIGNFFQSPGAIPIDLADHGIPGPVTHLKLVSLNNDGAWRGFELVGLTAITIAPPDPEAHVVVVTSNEVYEDRDFGRYFRDLPPTLILNATDDMPATIGSRPGETVTIEARVFDDIGIASVTLMVNGQPLALNPENRASFTASHPGNVHIEAIATDTGGNTVTKTTRYYVLNPDGTFPFDPSQLGQSDSGGATTTEVRVLTPGAGELLSVDTEIIADIVASPAVGTWSVEYAPIDEIDPYDLAAHDSDYVQIATGSGNVYSSPVATLPISTLSDGIYFLRIRAGDTYFGQVIAKNVSEADLRPQISIDSPSSGDKVMVTADIDGTIRSARPLREWYVEYANADQVDPNNINASETPWKRIAFGANTIDTSAAIANFDATLMKNDSYVVRIVAWNDIGLGRAEALSLEVAGEVKLGRNRLEFTDVSVDLAGFPLQFTRVYDSYQADENGELGYGWALNLQDPDIRETVADTGVGTSFGSTPFRDGTRVYITAPTGERLGFTFKPQRGPGSAFGSAYRVVLEPDPGVYHSLTIPEGDLAFLNLQPDGSVSLFFFNFPYNPDTYILTDPVGRRYTYHEDEGFMQAEDMNGNMITLNRRGIEHSAGSGIVFGRDASDRIETITGPNGMQWAYSYDAAGDLKTVTDPEGRVTTYNYRNDPEHYLESIMDPLGRMPVRYEYDPANGRLIATIDAQGNRHEVSWDPGSFTGSVTTPRGFVSQIVYDGRGNVTSETDPLGNITSFTYDDPANPDLETSVTDPMGDTWQFTYDARGNRIETRPPPISGTGVATATYNEFGKVTTSRDLAHVTSTFTYDENGNMLSQSGGYESDYEVQYSAEGLPVKVIASDLHQTNFEYDARGQLAGISDTIGYEATMVTNSAGFLSSLTDANGTTSTFDFDSRGLPISQANDTGDTTTLTENVDGSFTACDPNGLESTIKLDAQGNTTEMTLPGGGNVAINYDPSGNLSEVTDPTGNTFTFGYDPLERLNSIEDATGATQTFDYNSLGLISASTTASGKRRTFDYDANQRLVTENWHAPDNTIIRTFDYTYYRGDRIRTIEETAAGKTHTHTFGISVPFDSVLTGYADQTVFRLNYTWDRAGRGPIVPSKVALSTFSAAISDIRATYIGDKTYNLAWSIFGKGIRIVRNPDGSVKTLDRKISHSASHSKSHFTYSARGAVAAIRHEDNNGALIHPNSELTYTRSVGNRIAAINQGLDNTAVSYDPMGRVASATHSNTSYADETYTYDSVGNRLASHRLAGTGTVTTGNRLAAIGNFAFTHDADGNISKRVNTSTSEVTNFTYDHRNRLVTATVHPAEGSPASTTVNLGYDFADRLASREINGAKTWIIYDRDMPIAEFKDGASTISKMFFYSLDRVDDFHAVWNVDEGESWFMKDHLGSVRGILDENGDFVSWVDYDAYGNILGTPPANLEPLGYAGRFYLKDLGLYENRRRFYDPLVGRFTQPDPLHLKGGDINLYAYAGNNPMKWTDPYGTSALEYGQLVDLATFYLDNLCKLGNCVANIWKGVTEGTVNLTPVDPSANISGCAISFLPFDGSAGSAGNAAGGIVATGLGEFGSTSSVQSSGNYGGRALAIIGTVNSCKSLTFTVQGGSVGGNDN